jgi:hypothetical protein
VQFWAFMKKSVFLISFLLLSVSVYSQRQAIGLRVGDPVGLTYKKYFRRGIKALEFGIGTTGAAWHENYYKNSFKKIGRFQGFNYQSHIVESTIYLQARYMVNNQIVFEGIQGEWLWYWGFGAVAKSARIQYRYNDNGTMFTREYTDIDLGPEIIIGTEYKIEGVPINVFGEVSLMGEIINRVGVRNFGGVGIRYVF